MTRAWQELLLVFVLSLMMRLLWLGEASLWLDEAFSHWMAGKDGAGILEYTRTYDIHPPLFYLGLHAWLQVFPDSEWFLRFPQAVAGAFTVALLYAVACKTVGRRAARFCGVLGATSHYLLLFDQECRMYPWVSLAEMLYLWALLGLARSSKYSFGLLLAATWLGWYCDYRFALFAASAGLYFLVRNRNGMTLAALVMAALGTLPLIPWVLHQNGAGGQGGSLQLCHLPVGVESLAPLLPAMAGAWYLSLPVLANAALSVGLLALALVYRRGQGLAASAFFGQLLLILAYSLLRSSIYSVHACQTLVLPFLLGLGVALSQLPRRAGQAALAVWLLVNLVMFYRTHHEPALAKQNWRILAAQVLSGVQPGDLVVTLPVHQSFPLAYYFHSEHTLALNPVDLIEPEMVAPALAAPRSWWIFAGDLVVDPNGYSRAWLNEHFQVEAALELSNGPFHEITGPAIQVYLARPKSARGGGKAGATNTEAGLRSSGAVPKLSSSQVEKQ